MKLLTFLTLTLSILFATGDRVAKIKLKPIATTKDGYVEQYGWLVVHKQRTVLNHKSTKLLNSISSNFYPYLHFELLGVEL